MSSQDGLSSFPHQPSEPELPAADDASSTPSISETAAARVASSAFDDIATDDAIDDGAIENAFVGDVADEAAEIDYIASSEIVPAPIAEPITVVSTPPIEVLSATPRQTQSVAPIVSRIVSAVVVHATRKPAPVIAQAPVAAIADVQQAGKPTAAPLISAIMAAVIERAASKPAPAIATEPQPAVAVPAERLLPVAEEIAADEVAIDEANEAQVEEAFLEPEPVSEPAYIEAVESDTPVEASAPISDVPVIEESIQPSAPPRWKGLIRRPAFLRRREVTKQEPNEPLEAIAADEALSESDEGASDDPVIEEAVADIPSSDDSFSDPGTAANDECEDEFEEDDEPAEVGSTGGGWTIPMLCLGIAVIACCLIIPQADVNRRIAYERQALRQDLESVQTQVATNDEFLRKLAADPQLAERLAQRQLKLTRPGDKLLPITQGDAGTSPFDLVQVTPPRKMEPYQPVGGTIANLCYNPHTRLYLMGVGLFIMAAGLVLGVTPTVEVSRITDSSEFEDAAQDGQQKIPARFTIDATQG
jgi:hypothetical protein